MTEMTIASSRLLGLLDEIGRNRALTDEETDMIEEIVSQDTTPFRWNPRLDQGLLRAAGPNGGRDGGIARFARRHGITPMAAYSRLHRLRGAKCAKSRSAIRRGRV